MGSEESIDESEGCEESDDSSAEEEDTPDSWTEIPGLCYCLYRVSREGSISEYNQLLHILYKVKKSYKHTHDRCPAKTTHIPPLHGHSQSSPQCFSSTLLSTLHDSVSMVRKPRATFYAQFHAYLSRSRSTARQQPRPLFTFTHAYSTLGGRVRLKASLNGKLLCYF